MRKRIWLLCCLIVLIALMCLAGCRKEYVIVDGPGMVNQFAWYSFSISGSDDYAQHDFDITVTYLDEGGYSVTGHVTDEDGTEYENEEGVLLSESACQAIDALEPSHLPDLVSGTETSVQSDAQKVRIEVEYADGRRLEKTDENDFSLKVYEIVLPHFRDSNK